MIRETTHCKDINYSIIAEYDKDKPYYVKFKIHEIVAQNISPPVINEENLLWHIKGSLSHPNPTPNIEEAEIYLSGFVKWDGCSDWMFEENPYHFCLREDAMKIGELFNRLYTIASEIMKETEDDI